MENHAGRPEVRPVLRGEAASWWDVRFSNTVKTQMLYVAITLDGGPGLVTGSGSRGDGGGRQGGLRLGNKRGGGGNAVDGCNVK